MTCTLRNVQKTFTFEEQRQELNLLAADVYSICQNAVQVPLNVTTAPLGTASLTYNNNTGEFVYTPPDLSGYSLTNHTHDYNTLTNLPTLFDGDYNSLTNKPDLSIYLTSETSHADVLVDGDFTSSGLMSTDGSGNYSIDNSTYLTSVGSINEHTDVSTIGVDAPSPYDTLIWSGSVWKPGLVGNVPLTDFSVNTAVASGGGSLSYDSNTGVFDFAPAVVFSGDYDDLTNKPNIPTVPTNNNQLTNGAGYITGIGSFSIGALDDVDTTTVAPSPDKVLKWNGSDWVPGDASVVANLSDLGDVNVTNNAGTDGLVLKYQHSSQKWIAASDQTATGGSGISLTDLSVTVSQTPVGNGNLTYDDGLGVFTYIPPDFSSAGGIALTDISLTQNSASGGGALTYDDTTGEFEYTPPSIPAAQIKSDWNSTTGLSEILNKPTLFSGSYTDLTNKPTLFDGDYTSLSNTPTLFSGDYDDLTNKPAIPAAQVNSDWNATTGLGEILNKPTLFSGSYNDLTDTPAIPAAQIQADWNQSGTSALDYIKNKPTVPTKIEDLDVTLNQLSIGHVLKWNGTNWENAVDTTGAGGSGIALSDLSVGTESIASGDGGISYNDNTGVFTYTPPVISSSVQSDWDQNSSSADDYIKNKPAIPAAQIQVDWNQSGTSALDYIKNKPTIPAAQVQSDWNATTGLGEILNKPTIATNNNQLTNGAGYITSFTEADTLNTVTGRGSTTTNAITVGGNGTTGGVSLLDGNIAVRTGTGNVASIDLYCEVSNAHKISIKAPLHANYSGDVNFVLPPDEGTNGWFLKTDGSGNTSWAQQSTPSTPNLDAVLTAGNTSTTAVTVGNFTCSNLTVNGTTTTVNSNTVNIGDNILVLNSDETSAPSQNGGIEIERGTSTNVSLRWNETSDKWQYTNDGTNFENIGGGFTSGMIMMYKGTVAPSGWVICDNSTTAQNAGAPDLRDRFVIGAGNTYSLNDTGGSADAVIVSHDHNANSGSDGNHVHSVGANGTTNNTGNHEHGDGNYGTNNTGNHSHNQSGSGSGSTGNQSANHYHTTDTSVNTGSDGVHQHRWGTDDLIGAQGGTNNPDASGGTDWRAWTDSQGAHSHTFNFTHDTMGVSQNHTHDFNFNIGGSTGNDGSHSHNVTGNSGNGGSHSHNLNITVNETTTGNHAHNVSIDSEGSSGVGKNLPPYYALMYIMKL